MNKKNMNKKSINKQMDVILENLTNILERSGYEISFPGSAA